MEILDDGWGQEPDQEEEKVVAEFSHDELYSFFLDLEKMQEQIDALS